MAQPSPGDAPRAQVDGCYGCTNQAHRAPMSPAQSHASVQLLSSSTLVPTDLSIVTNSDGVVGAAYLEICDGPIDVQGLTEEHASSERCGAISTFLGVTRNHYKGREVARLEYEAFTSMALKQMGHIVKRVFSEFAQVHRVVISHRIGVVPVKAASVFIAVSSEHRESGLAAVAFAINALKMRVPVWKREYYVGDGPTATMADGEESAWKRNAEYASPVASGAPQSLSTTTTVP